MPTESRIRVAQALHGVFGQGSRIPDTWDAGLPAEDAAFGQALLGFTLRRWGRLMAYVHARLKDPSRGLPLGSQIPLALGLAQLAWMPGVSSHAAVNESVALTHDRTLGFPPHHGLANALLRAGARDREALRQALDALPRTLDRSPFAERVLHEALLPFGGEAHAEELWARLLEPARPFFRRIKDDPLPEGLVPDPELPGAYALLPEAPFPRAWLEGGSGMVQDHSSQALMAFTWDRPVGRIADLCAAPGGKTTTLALRWPGAELHAVEQHPRRARRLGENLAARGIQARIAVEDAATWLQGTDEPLDLILLDAPCSGSGTLQKHPELVWLGDTLELERLAEAQRSLAMAAAGRLAPGGLLIYSVCSWLQAEHLPGIDPGKDLSGLRPAEVWPGPSGPSSLFQPDPLAWPGEGFFGSAWTR
jgi:16S rRNA (cytosine967-C5)-methyltransferase